MKTVLLTILVFVSLLAFLSQDQTAAYNMAFLTPCGQIGLMGVFGLALIFGFMAGSIERTAPCRIPSAH